MSAFQLTINKRKIQIVLGSLWLIDGMLQLQHQMFTKNFAYGVIQPAAQGQPHLMSTLMYFGIHVFLLNPVLFNSVVALIQLSLGLFILWKKTTRWGLLASIPWGLFVWAFGEGFSGLLSGHTLLLMGAPGAALLYAVIAVAVLPAEHSETSNATNEAAKYWLAIVWLVVWLVGAVYQLLPGQDSVSAVKSMILANATGAPGWLAHLDTQTAIYINGLGVTKSMAGQHMGAMQMAMMPASGSGYPYILLFAIGMAIIGFGVLRPGWIRTICLGLGIVLAISFWIVGQSLGGYYTGLATDPNTGPLVVLLGLAIMGSPYIDDGLHDLGKKINLFITG